MKEIFRNLSNFFCKQNFLFKCFQAVDSFQLSAVVLATTAHAQANDWSWKGGWDVDLGDLNPTHEGEYVYNPKVRF